MSLVPKCLAHMWAARYLKLLGTFILSWGLYAEYWLDRSTRTYELRVYRNIDDKVRYQSKGLGNPGSIKQVKYHLFNSIILC